MPVKTLLLPPLDVRDHASEPLGRQPGKQPELCVSAVIVSAIRENPGQSLARAQNSGATTCGATGPVVEVHNYATATVQRKVLLHFV